MLKRIAFVFSCGCMLAAAGAAWEGGVYVKKPTWTATMAASRARYLQWLAEMQKQMASFVASRGKAVVVEDAATMAPAPEPGTEATEE